MIDYSIKSSETSDGRVVFETYYSIEKTSYSIGWTIIECSITLMIYLLRTFSKSCYWPYIINELCVVYNVTYRQQNVRTVGKTGDHFRELKETLWWGWSESRTYPDQSNGRGEKVKVDTRVWFPCSGLLDQLYVKLSQPDLTPGIPGIKIVRGSLGRKRVRSKTNRGFYWSRKIKLRNVYWVYCYWLSPYPFIWSVGLFSYGNSYVIPIIFQLWDKGDLDPSTYLLNSDLKNPDGMLFPDTFTVVISSFYLGVYLSISHTRIFSSDRFLSVVSGSVLIPLSINDTSSRHVPWKDPWTLYRHLFCFNRRRYLKYKMTSFWIYLSFM